VAVTGEKLSRHRKPLSASMAYSHPLPQPPAAVFSDTMPVWNGELGRERADEGLGKLSIRSPSDTSTQ
jgi:hypothetical protein